MMLKDISELSTVPMWPWYCSAY